MYLFLYNFKDSIFKSLKIRNKPVQKQRIGHRMFHVYLISAFLYTCRKCAHMSRNSTDGQAVKQPTTLSLNIVIDWGENNRILNTCIWNRHKIFLRMDNFLQYNFSFFLNIYEWNCLSNQIRKIRAIQFEYLFDHS